MGVGSAGTTAAAMQGTGVGTLTVFVTVETRGSGTAQADVTIASMSNVRAWPKPTGRARDDLTKPIKRPCDFGLELAITALETQLGTIEAYNRLVITALVMKSKIDNGDATAQNPLFAVRPKG